MQIDISGIRISITEEIDRYIKKKLNKLNKYFRRISSIRVTLKAEKEGYLTEINVTADGVTIHGNEIDSDLYNSVEAAIDKVNRQARKHKEKVKSHRLRDSSGKRTSYSSSVAPGTTEHKMIYTTREIAKPMVADEAVMQLEMERSLFLVFLNSSTKQINVVYKREDGSFVLIEPQI